MLEHCLYMLCSFKLQVCKNFLVRFCPHELFTNTKADLGPCEKIHDERIRDAYRKNVKFECMGYEEDFVRFSQSMIADVERRIKRGRQRLSLTQQENSVSLFMNYNYKLRNNYNRE